MKEKKYLTSGADNLIRTNVRTRIPYSVRMRKELIITGMALLMQTGNTLSAQDFVNIPQSQLRIDSLLPKVSHYIPLPKGYQDSTYSVQLQYPEYVALNRKQRRKYRKLTGGKNAPDTLAVNTYTYQERKNGTLALDFTPIVKRNNKLCYITSFKPVTVATAKATALTRAATTDASQTYTENSILRQGNWAKIRVSNTGIHQLTADITRKAGFNDLSKVKIYGYGGAIIPERLTQSYLQEHDDLKEIPTCTANGIKFFYAQGPVSWSSKKAIKRSRNFYSDYGYYFITESDDAPLTCTEAELLQQVTDANDAYHYLYENDKYAFAEMGRNLFDSKEVKYGSPITYNVEIPAGNTSANIQVAIGAAKVASTASYRITCGTQASTGSISLGEYYEANATTRTFVVNDLDNYPKDTNGATLYPITIEATNAATSLRLDYVSAYFATPETPVALSSGNYPVAEYYCNITNQNLHADEPVDNIIIIPTSQRLRAQAIRLGELHKKYNNMTYRIVPADELYNEFSSGTPDISAYRRYLKMFYDKANSSDDIPKNVILFGDAVWDNRMITLPAASYNPDNYLLCYETENSYFKPSSTAIDDFITVLQDNTTIHADENSNGDKNLQFDVAIGRIPVTSEGEAKNVVDKIIHYVSSAADGEWQNDIMFMGDDGDGNSHMQNIDDNANDIMQRFPGYNVKKVMLDAYVRQSAATGDTYPEATAAVKKQQNNGALIMNYGGHASWTLLSHEKMLVLSDFQNFKGTNYSLWFTAGCETVPFDGTTNTIGEAAVLNSNGGAIAFIGTVRTVYEAQNTAIDKAFMRHVLNHDSNDNPLTIGEALRQAKNDLVTGNAGVGKDMTVNKHHFTLIGDPAMSLALPKNSVVIDYINGKATAEIDTIKGNSIVTVEGHIANRNNEPISDFNGTANILVRDSKQYITCRGNDANTSDLFIYSDRPSTLFKGSCTVTNGQFSFTFRMPRDIYNDGEQGLMTIYAQDSKQGISANGETDSFIAEGWEDTSNDYIGPSIYAYLNSPSFTNGGTVGLTPYFVAEVSDNDGVNVSNSSLGHNMELIIDGKTNMTYDITDNFVFDNNSYTTGQTYYVLPALAPGNHSLSFKAWDVLGNSNSVSLDFRVVKGLQPTIANVRVYPAIITDEATFYVTHDMQGSEADIYVDIIDPSGRIVQILQWSDVFSETSPTTSYRWTPNGLSQGLYLYRVRLSCNGSDYVSATQKLIIGR